MDFNKPAKGVTAAPVYVWSAPFDPAQHIPQGKDIFVVNFGGNNSQAIVFGDYISDTANKKANNHIQTGRPVADADGNVAAARLTQDGGLTNAGVAYCKTHGLQGDIESLTKWAKLHVPEGLKYKGFETAGRAAAPA